MPKKKLRGSTATYLSPKRKNYSCDLEELAEIYSIAGNVPERIGWVKAQEISLLARYFAMLWKQEKKRRKQSPDKTVLLETHKPGKES